MSKVDCVLEITKVTRDQAELDGKTEEAVRSASKTGAETGTHVCDPVCLPRFCCPETGWLGGHH